MKPSMAIYERQPVEFHDGEIQGEENEREDNEGREERHKLSFHLLGSQEPHEENGQRNQHQTKEGRSCPRVSRCPAVAGFVAVVTHILPLFFSRLFRRSRTSCPQVLHGRAMPSAQIDRRAQAPGRSATAHNLQGSARDVRHRPATWPWRPWKTKSTKDDKRISAHSWALEYFNLRVTRAQHAQLRRLPN